MVTPDQLTSEAQTDGQVSAAVHNALQQAREGALSPEQATTLLAVRGHELQQLCRIAADLRDVGLAEEGRDRQITYSRKVFIPLTRLCRDRCHYCTFVTVPGKLSRAGHGMFLELDQVVEIARQGAELGCKEALFTLGDRPEDRWPEAQQWLDERGYSSTLDYVRSAAIRVLEETGLLPHLNPGVMSAEEMSRLKPVAPSMGMMLETTARRLFTDRGNCHYGSPDKDPEIRKRVLVDAGRMSIPFTTGILVGIGESFAERADSLIEIGKIHNIFGNIQEVIVQNFRAKPDTAMRGVADAEFEEFLAAVAVARIVLGPRMRIQAPPNLVSPAECAALVSAGVDDWGGVSPLTPDHVNPERPWPNLESLAEITAATGYTLTERVTAQPRYVLQGAPWIDPAVAGHLQAVADPTTGLAADIRPSGRPWGVVREAGRVPARGVPDFGAALDRAHADPAGCSPDDYLTLAHADGEELDALVALADSLRRQTAGDDVTYVPSRIINTLSVCEPGCRYCATSTHSALSAEQVADRAGEASIAGVDEVCIRADPDATVADCCEYIRAIKARVPFMHVSLLVPAMIGVAVRAGGPVAHTLLAELRDAGLDHIGGAAGLSMGANALSVAHELGLRSTATLVYGHGGGPSDWVRELGLVREMFDRTGGFVDFVPLPFWYAGAPVPSVDATKPTIRDSRAVHALSRVMLHGRIATIGTSLLGLGVADAQLMLQSGASDLGRTAIEETIARSTGSHHGLAWTPAEMRSIAGAIGRPAHERSVAGVRKESAA
ncbi:7,8-didemethyl-8-hydroxy-5-deazariboflavin synthase CofG [Williamsia muralis]|uniref:7,8-didemethyl-8-hydroxy-5-deazariboflavin synthase n=1 Tax=Williamsia marianensis TaxID=85044 RepID=A0A2G3PJ24_WILMA|nr:7,8-didemethyl-8-hydroxy-5-deazariboflavin synthase CofG [Williamsia marianensis]PHV65805.1 7,8-didemethyl-8-hydroxy-5-deazariboflavin synthase subunit CofG [Williamsia marianensis]